MTIHAACHVLVVVLSICCTSGAEDCPGGVCDSQSSALLQKAQLSETAQLVDTEEDGERSAYKTHQRRATMLIETDLSKYSHSHYKWYDPKKSVDENIKEAFDHFLAEVGLDKELDEEEKSEYWRHFAEDIALRLKHEHDHDDAIVDLETFDPEKFKLILETFDPKQWRTDVSNALEAEKPMVTKKLVESINAANLLYTVTYGKSSAQPKRVWDSMMGLKPRDDSVSSGSEAVLLQTQGLAIPASFDSAQQWPSCSDVILRVHDQGVCGSCWAFAALSALDSRLCIKTNASWSGPRAMLSRGQVTSCAYSERHLAYGIGGCDGGDIETAYKNIFENGGGGVTGGTEGCSPYFGHGEGKDHFAASSSTPPCPTICTPSYTSRAMAKDRFKFPSMQVHKLPVPVEPGYRSMTRENFEIAKESMMTGGPVAFDMRGASMNSFMAYNDGIYDADCSAAVVHAVAAVGWGTHVDDNGIKTGYISAMNSWGDWWGERGGFKITECGVAAFVVADFTFTAGKDVPDPLLAPEGPTPAPTRATPPWEVTFGPCTRDSAGCIMSGNYPQPYSNNEECQFKVHRRVPIEVVDFSTEFDSDWFRVNNGWYTGGGRSFHGKAANSMQWLSDKAGTLSGWKLCPGPSSGDADGTPAPTPPFDVCSHANIMLPPYLYGGTFGVTEAECVRQCIHSSLCKAVIIGVSKRTSSYCYFVSDYIATESIAYPGFVTVQCKDCPASNAATTANPTTSPTDMPTARPTDMPTGRPTSMPTASPTSLPTSAPTPMPPASAATCSFEKDDGCGIWTNSQSDKFDWTRRSGTTPSGNTGPAQAGDGLYYMYIEASSRETGDMAVLEAKGLALSGPGQLKFMYSMYGEGTGSLNVIANGHNVFNRSGNLRDSIWRTAAVKINSDASGKLDLRFEGVIGPTWTSDIAVDNIIVESGGSST